MEEEIVCNRERDLADDQKLMTITNGKDFLFFLCCLDFRWKVERNEEIFLAVNSLAFGDYFITVNCRLMLK